LNQRSHTPLSHLPVVDAHLAAHFDPEAVGRKQPHVAPTFEAAASGAIAGTTSTPALVSAAAALEDSDHRAATEETSAGSAQLRPIKRKKRARKPVAQQSINEQPTSGQPIIVQSSVQQPAVQQATVTKPRLSLKSKHPLEETPQAPIPDWYPAFWSPAVQGCAILEDETARVDRAELLASTTTPYAIPQEFTKRREKYWRVMPTVKFANATPRNQAKIFVFSIAIAQHLGTHITTKDDAAEASDVGLPAQLWKQVATEHGDDLGHPDGFERTKLYLRQFGMQFVIDQLEGQTPDIISRREPVGHKLIGSLLDDVDELDYGEQKLVDLDAQEWDPRYFQQDRVGEHEELRYQSEPLGWRYTAFNVRRHRDAFIFVVPTGVEAHERDVEGDRGLLQWRQIATTERDFGELFADSDVWECYEYGVVFLLSRYGDPGESDACGEQFLNPSIIFRVNEGGQKVWLADGTRGGSVAEYNSDPFVLRDMRVWHGHDEHHSYVTQLPGSIPTYLSLI